jgi:U3 small nucleolar RNA-associated protein 10
MPTQLADQLAKIAAKSSNPLNLKAQKLAHGQSLLFEPRIAAAQDFDSLYTLCTEGFQELCLLDNRFATFQRSIFSAQSKSEDRTQMTRKENEELDRVLEDFLGLVGARLLLKPAIKAVEWLVRRFRYVADILPYRQAGRA